MESKKISRSMKCEFGFWQSRFESQCCLIRCSAEFFDAPNLVKAAEVCFGSLRLQDVSFSGRC